MKPRTERKLPASWPAPATVRRCPCGAVTRLGVASSARPSATGAPARSGQGRDGAASISARW